MSWKFLAGFLPALLLSVGAWHFSKMETVELPVSAAGPPAPATLEAAVRAAYTPFDIGHTYVLPAGPKGLEYSALARSLDGQKVSLTGSMVRHLHEDPSVFLLAEQPMVLNVPEFGLADSLPPNAVHVLMPVLPGMAPDWVRQPLVIYGRLELGTREERDGRISQVRLYADHVTAADGSMLIEPRRSVLLQPARVRSGKLKPPALSARTPQ